MSTISTHLNWGASYVTNDVYRRFVRPDASERQLVVVGRVTTVCLMVLAALLALLLENALQAFQILLQIGAGTGLLFLLRWFWWRINAWSELTAMVVSFAVALGFVIGHRLGLNLAPWQELLTGVGITTIAWVAVTLLTPPASEEILRDFHRLVRPGGPGWRPVIERARADGIELEVEERGVLARGVGAMLLGCLTVYSALFGIGWWLYGRPELAVGLLLVAAVTAGGLTRLWGGVSGSPTS
jgi:hypothetical protein